MIPDVYLNAGGVVVSYFEWARNLSHMRFGLLEKRLEIANTNALLNAAETLSGKRLSMEMRQNLVTQSDEKELVVSGLEEKMTGAYDEIRGARDRFPGMRHPADRGVRGGAREDPALLRGTRDLPLIRPRPGSSSDDDRQSAHRSPAAAGPGRRHLHPLRALRARAGGRSCWPA